MHIAITQKIYFLFYENIGYQFLREVLGVVDSSLFLQQYSNVDRTFLMLTENGSRKAPMQRSLRKRIRSREWAEVNQESNNRGRYQKKHEERYSRRDETVIT